MSTGSVNTGDSARLHSVRITLAAAAACGLLLSWRLWVSSPRQYPTVPVSRLLPRVPYPLDFVWLAALLALLAAVALARESRKFVAAFLVLAGLLCLWDQSRWQPWFYMYLLMLLPFCFDAGIGGDDDGRAAARRRAIMNTCRLIVVSTYFWSGLQKLNYVFFTQTARTLTYPYARRLPESLQDFVPPLLFVAPFAEMAVAVGLLTHRLRSAAVVLALATHAAILAVFVPVRDNVVIWPWNVAMGVLVWLLFAREQSFSARDVLRDGRFVPHKVAVLLFGVMPFFGLFGLWDSYLSSALYTGHTSQARLYVSDSLRERLPPEVRGRVQTANGRHSLNVGRWSYAELNVPAYPEPRIYREAGRWVCGHAERPSDAVLEIRGRANFLDGHRNVEMWDCDQLNKAISD